MFHQHWPCCILCHVSPLQTPNDCHVMFLLCKSQCQFFWVALMHATTWYWLVVRIGPAPSLSAALSRRVILQEEISCAPKWSYLHHVQPQDSKRWAVTVQPVPPVFHGRTLDLWFDEFENVHLKVSAGKLMYILPKIDNSFTLLTGICSGIEAVVCVLHPHKPQGLSTRLQRPWQTSLS